MWGWLWYQPTTRVRVPVSAEKASATAEHRAICSGLASTRSWLKEELVCLEFKQHLGSL